MLDVLLWQLAALVSAVIAWHTGQERP